MRIRRDSDEMQEDEILLIARVSDALAHPARIKIFRFIMSCNKQLQPVCNKDVVAHFDYAQATISQHIGTLVKSGLVEVKKENKFSYYYVNIGMLSNYLAAARKFD